MSRRVCTFLTLTLTMPHKVTRYTQSRYITPAYRFAPRMTRITEYFLPDEKLIFYTDGSQLLNSEPSGGPHLVVPNLDDGTTCQAEDVEDYMMDDDTYACILEWHCARERVQFLRNKLEDLFFNEPEDL